MSAAVLSISKTGEPSTEQEAKRGASDQLFKLLVWDPWVVLNFGGTEHCVKSGGGDDPESVPVRPLSAQSGRDAELRRDLAASTQISADGKTCVNNGRKYAAHFLRWAPGDLKRSNDEDSDPGAYVALRKGDASRLPDADPDKARAQFGPEDRPAVEQMEPGGQFDRLVMAIVIFVGELGPIVLLGALSLGVMLAQVVVLLLLAFAPVLLVLAILPGRGHQVFLGWLSRMGTFLLRKFIYSLLIAVLLAIGAAMMTASANLGWFMAFGLQAAFFWAILLYRKELVQQVNAAITGIGGGGGDVLRRLQGAYYGGVMLRKPAAALAGVAAAPVTVPTAIVAAQIAKKKAAKRAAQATRRAASDRQDLADRIASNLLPPQQPDDSNGPPTPDGTRRPPEDHDGVPTRDPTRGPRLDLLRRYPTGPDTDDGTSSTTGAGDRPGGPDQRRDPSRPGDRRSTVPPPPGQPGQPARPGQQPPAGDPGAGNGRGRPPDRDKPLSLTDSLAEDEARMRERREQREASARAREAERDRERRVAPPPRRRRLPRPRFRGRPPRPTDEDVE